MKQIKLTEQDMIGIILNRISSIQTVASKNASNPDGIPYCMQERILSVEGLAKFLYEITKGEGKEIK